MNSNARETTPHPGPPSAIPEPPAPRDRFLFPSGARPLAGYTIKRGIGIGGFGEIYYAVSDAGKEVALKLVRRHLDVELRGIRQCLNLKHPNLIALYDIRQDDQGGTWVVMEYASGQCLEDVLAAQPHGMPTPEALAWFRGIAAAIAYLHDRGIVHRDLKPGNLFCDEGLVKVGDYGLSKFISCSRRSGQTESVGTVHYMAPEVANGRYGHQIDIYALGVILYEMLTGRVPFEGESVGEVLMKHLTAPPDLAGLGEPYRSVVAKALEKDPANRFPSVADMLAALPAGPATPVGLAPPMGHPPGPAPPYPASSVPPPHPPARGEEPILHWIRHSVGQLRAAWHRSDLSSPTRIVLLGAALFVLVASAGSWMPMAMLLVMVYGVYRVVRSIGLAFRSRRAKRPPPVPAVPAACASPPPRARPDPWLKLRQKPSRQRAAELLAAMLTSALVGATMCLVMTILAAYRGRVPQSEQIAWLLSVSVAGSWAVLIPAKLWEGRRGETALRRFVLLLTGLGVGLFAAGVHAFLTYRLPDAAAFLPPDPELTSVASYRLPATFYADGSPRIMAYLACFGSLFFVLRWWRQADPLRSARLSLWWILVSAVVAGVVASVWHFPQPWLVMVAAVMSISIQLSSPRWEPVHTHA